MSKPIVLECYEDFVQHVLQAEQPAVVDFTAAWCAPCRRLAPVLEELGDRHAGLVRVAVVRVEDVPQLVQTYRVTSMPTLLGFHRGQVVAQLVGFGGRGPVEKLFAELAGFSGPAGSRSIRTPLPLLVR